MRWLGVALLLLARPLGATEVHFTQTGARFASRPLPSRANVEGRDRSGYWKDMVFERIDWTDPSGDPKPASSRRMLALGAATNPRGRIRRVLYAMSRSDVARAFQAFSGPKGAPVEVWLVDDHPFGDPGRVGQMFESSEGKFNFYIGHHNEDLSAAPEDQPDERGRAPGVGPGLLWELERLGVAAISVRYLDDNGQPLGPEALARVTTMAPVGAWIPRQAPIVQLRFALAGQMRVVHYVQHRIGGEDPLPSALEAFLRRGYDAFFEKASGWKGTFDRPEMRDFRELALTGLRPRVGRVVTDDPTWQKAVKARRLPLERMQRLNGGAQTHSNGRSVWVFRRTSGWRGGAAGHVPSR
jgi:hypothetical protein